MVPGRANGTLEMGGNVMVLTKDYTDVIFNQSFRFSPIPGFDSGLTVKLVNTGKSAQLTSSDRVLGIGVSQYCLIHTYIIYIYIYIYIYIQYYVYIILYMYLYI